MKKLIKLIKSIDFNGMFDTANLLLFSSIMLSIGFLGWIPVFLSLQYFSTAYFLYAFVFKFLKNIPGFMYIEILYIKVITIFPFVDVFLKLANPYYS